MNLGVVDADLEVGVNDRSYAAARDAAYTKSV
jgi:hypothetical protein